MGNEEDLRKVITGSSKNMAMSVTHLDEGTEDTWTAAGVRALSCPDSQLICVTLPGC